MSNIHKFHCAIETLNWLIYTITFDLTQINIVDDTAYDKIIITFTTLFFSFKDVVSLNMYVDFAVVKKY